MEVEFEVHPAYIFNLGCRIRHLPKEMFLFTFTLRERGAHGLNLKSTCVPYLVRRVVNSPFLWVRLGKHCLLEGA